MESSDDEEFYEDSDVIDRAEYLEFSKRKLGCDVCKRALPPRYLVLVSRKNALCLMCSGYFVNLFESIPVPNIVQLTMRRETDGNSKKFASDVKHISRLNGINLRYKSLKQPKRIPYDSLLDQNHILVYGPRVEEGEDLKDTARSIVHDMGFDKATVLDASLLLSTEKPKQKPRQYTRGFAFNFVSAEPVARHALLPKSPHIGEDHLIIRMSFDWRSRFKGNLELEPNEILLFGIPYNAVEYNANLDKYLVRSIAMKAGVNIKECMFNVIRFFPRQKCKRDSTFPPALLLRFQCHEDKENLAKALRKCKDMFERAPCEFASLSAEWQWRYHNLSLNNKLCPCETLKDFVYNIIHDGEVVRIKCRNGDTRLIRVGKVRLEKTVSATSAV